MFYLGIDQHARQLTVNLRDQNGDVRLRKQVSNESRNLIRLSPNCRPMTRTPNC